MRQLGNESVNAVTVSQWLGTGILADASRHVGDGASEARRPAVVAGGSELRLTRETPQFIVSALDKSVGSGVEEASQCDET